MSPFVSEELRKLSQDIINQALTKPTMGKPPNVLVDRLLLALKKQREPLVVNPRIEPNLPKV